MDHVLGGLESTFVYLDDIMVFSKDEESHLTIMEELFNRLTKNGLAIHLSKCVFAAKSLEFLGFHVDGNGIRPLEKKVKAITDFPPPTNAKCLLGFLGSLNFYRRALPNGVGGRTAADTLQPLYDFAARKRGVREKFSDAWTTQNMDTHYENAGDILCAWSPILCCL